MHNVIITELGNNLLEVAAKQGYILAIKGYNGIVNLTKIKIIEREKLKDFLKYVKKF